MVRIEADGTRTVVKPPTQESTAASTPERVPAQATKVGDAPTEQRGDLQPMAAGRRARVHCPAVIASVDLERGQPVSTMDAA